MTLDTDLIEIVRAVCMQFADEFISHPYLCYTEPGLHALFYSRLLTAIPEEQRYTTWMEKQVCVIQKEYRTAGNLGKPQRQHWDISVVKTPPISLLDESPLSYDYLRLDAAIEFGMNEDREHLDDDLERLTHPEANTDHGIVFHLYRLSKSRALVSNRDWSSKSKRITPLDEVVELSQNYPVEIIYCVSDGTNIQHTGAWMIDRGKVRRLDIYD